MSLDQPALDPHIVAIRALARSRYDIFEEVAIITLIRELNPDQFRQLFAEPAILDLVVARVNTQEVDYPLRAELFELLFGRLDEVNAKGHANLIFALEVGRTNRLGQDLITQILTAQRGVALTELKNEVNARDDAHDLNHLLFEFLDKDLREKLLHHFADEAATIQSRDVKILSDIDDTAISSLKDERFPRGGLYPGVIAFWAALDRGPQDTPLSLGDLTFVTARPGGPLSVIENRARRMLSKAGVRQSSVLSGSFTHIFTHGLMAERKINNIREFRAAYPEYDLVFVGDSGQGDIQVGRTMLTDFPNVVKAVLIHDVVALSTQERHELSAQGIQVFDTYVGAAGLAYERGLISRHGLISVIKQTQADFASVTWDSNEQQVLATAALESDLHRYGGLATAVQESSH